MKKKTKKNKRIKCSVFFDTAVSRRLGKLAKNTGISKTKYIENVIEMLFREKNIQP